MRENDDAAARRARVSELGVNPRVLRGREVRAFRLLLAEIPDLILTQPKLCQTPKFWRTLEDLFSERTNEYRINL